MRKIGVIGLGYVGLPLALLAESKKFKVIGLDENQEKLRLLKDGVSPLNDDEIATKLKGTNIQFTSDYSLLTEVDAAIICVPTPVNENKLPDLSIVKSASVAAAKYLTKGSLLIIESTINPGVCDEVIIPAIEKDTTHKVGITLGVAHCPERINPGDPKWHVGNIARVLGADSNESLDKAFDFYNDLVDAPIKKMDTIKEAEACKVVENSFRDINIAFVNELAMSFQKLGINVKNVIDGAATKPFAFMPHYPGIGVGGHCIPVDPYYLIEYARGNGFEHHFLSLARTINENMPVYAIDSLEQMFLENAQGSVSGKTITVLGLSYKPNVGDDRESPAYSVIRELENRGAKIKVFDPFIKNKKYSSSENLGKALTNSDAAILVTGHEDFDLKTILNSEIKVFYDGRNHFINSRSEFTDRGISYLGV